MKNSGGGTLSYSISDNKSWISVSPTSGSSTGEYDFIYATVNRFGLSPGSYTGKITIDPSTGSNQYVDINMTVPNHSPTASRYDPTSLSVSLAYGATKTFKARGQDVDGDIDYADWTLTGSQNDSDHDAMWHESDIISSYTHTFDKSGSYSLTCKFTDENSAAASVSWNITVQEPPKPDLRVRSLTVSKTTVIPSDKVEIEAIVRNYGQADAVKSKIRYYFASSPGGQTTHIADGDIPNFGVLSPGEESTDSPTAFPQPDFEIPDVSPGTYYITAIADYFNIVDEINEGVDNEKYIAITVQEPPKPDFTILTSETYLIPSSPVANENFKVHTQIKNQGLADYSGIIYIVYYINGEYFDKTVLWNGLGAGQSDPLGESSKYISLGPGDYEIKVVVDPDDIANNPEYNIEEENELNNSYTILKSIRLNTSTTISINGAKKAYTQYTLSGALEKEGSPFPNQTLILQIDRNCDGDYNDSGETQNLTTDGSGNYSWTSNYSTPAGNCKTKASYNGSSTCYPSSKEMSWIMDKLDITVTGLNATLEEDGFTTLTAYVDNEYGNDVGEGMVTFSINGNNIGSSSVDSTGMATLTYNWDTHWGSHGLGFGTFSIVASYGGEHSWNTGSSDPSTLTVNEIPKPRIELTLENVYLNSIPHDVFYPGETVTIKLIASNTGIGVNAIATLNVFNNDYSRKIYDSHTVGEDQTSVLNENETDTYTFSFTIPSDASYGIYRVIGAIRKQPWNNDEVLDTTGPEIDPDDWSDNAYIEAFTVLGSSSVPVYEHDPIAGPGIPLVLVHGNRGELPKDGYDPEKEYCRWLTFMNECIDKNIDDFKKFDVYVWMHDTSRPIGFNGTTGNSKELTDYIYQKILPEYNDDTKVLFLAHSRGGLVVRSFMNYDKQGDDVLGLISLGTPHHGSPLAVPDWSAISWKIIFGNLLNSKFEDLYNTSGTFDTDRLGDLNLAWDNQDNAFGEDPIIVEFDADIFPNGRAYLSLGDANNNSNIHDDETIFYSEDFNPDYS